MKHGVALLLVGSVVLGGLAGCGRWFEQRAAWRHDAEVACLQSGAVREGPGVAALRPIDGPGICGADFPLRVSMLGGSQVLGFADDLRPPGVVPTHSTAEPAQPPYPAAPRRAADPVAPEIAPGPAEMLGPPAGAPAYGGSPRNVAPATPLGAQVGPERPGPATVNPPATLACPIVSALDSWLTHHVQPAALRWLGQPVIEIKQISAYSCRSMNGQWGAQISEHAFGNALDIAAFTLADGRRVTVRDGWHGMPAERAFLHDVQASACETFSTVLAPGSNVFHYDHIHVDLARHAGDRSVCKPAPIPGELIARGDAGVTGTVGGSPAAARWDTPGRDDSVRFWGGSGED